MLRFGKYGTSDTVINTLPRISKTLGLKAGIVHYWVKHYLSNNNRILDFKELKVQRRPKSFDEDALKYIYDPAILYQWRSYSLTDRCIKIQALLGIKVSRITLANYYKKVGIRYRKAGYRYFSKDTLPEVKLEEQRLFVFRLCSFMQKGHLIVYLDETSTHLWEKGVSLWQPKNQNYNVMLNKERGKGITIAGALQSVFPPYHSFNLQKSSNAEELLQFIVQFINWVRT